MEETQDGFVKRGRTNLSICLLAGAWLIGYAQLLAGERLVALVGVVAVMAGAGCPMLLMSWWERSVGTFAAGGAILLCAVVWLVGSLAPGPASTSAIGLACGAVVGGVGLRLAQQGQQSGPSLIVAGGAGLGILTVIGTLPRVAGANVAAAVSAIMGLFAVIAIAIAVAAGERLHWPRAADVKTTVAALSGAGVMAVAVWSAVGHPGIFVVPVSIAAGAHVAVWWRRRRGTSDTVPDEVGPALVVVLICGTIGLVAELVWSLPRATIIQGAVVLVIAAAGYVGVQEVRRRIRR